MRKKVKLKSMLICGVASGLLSCRKFVAEGWSRLEFDLSSADAFETRWL